MGKTLGSKIYNLATESPRDNNRLQKQWSPLYSTLDICIAVGIAVILFLTGVVRIEY